MQSLSTTIKVSHITTSLFTRANHFSHVVRETLKHGSFRNPSAFDIDLIWNFHKNGRINKDTHIINNGLKTDAYLQKSYSYIDLDLRTVLSYLIAQTK